MPTGIQYDANGFIIGGNPAAKITPNFRIREFSGVGGLYVHRELVGALQELRDACGQALRIRGLEPAKGLGVGKRGLFAWLDADDPDAVVSGSDALCRLGYFSKLVKKDGLVYAEMPLPDQLPPFPATAAFEIAMRLTSAYETGGDPYQQVTGNFDGAGLSFGPLQVNFGTGTLQVLFGRFRQRDAAKLERCFDNPEHYSEWRRLLGASRKKQVEWAGRLSQGAGNRGFAQPWKEYLQAVGRVRAFRDETLKFAYDTYGRRLMVQLAWLKGLQPVKIDRFPCLSALYDLCVQQGGLEKAHDAIRRRVLAEAPSTQTELVHIAVEERGRKAKERWRADCISRRLGILYRAPQRISESGQTACRDNPKLYLVRDVAVRGIERYLTV